MTPISAPEFDLEGAPHHPAVEEIVKAIQARTDRHDRSFFQALCAYYLCLMAGTMRVNVYSDSWKKVPVNAYVINFATSGYGKGYSVFIFEQELLKPFRRRFMSDTLPVLSEQALWDKAHERAGTNGTDPQTEFDKALKDLREYGHYPFTFDGGTGPALLQLRNQMLIRKCGALNMTTDEIGSKLLKSSEILTTYMELWDQGLVKNHIVKNSSDNKRAEDMEGHTPTNMLLFGTPNKLFDGSSTEKEFYDFLETGYSRRCFFGYGEYGVAQIAGSEVDDEAFYDQLVAAAADPAIDRWAGQFHGLANPSLINWTVTMDRIVSVKLLRYKRACERAAASWPEHEEIRKAELMHRYAKAMKLAGALAFVDGASDMGMDHLMAAIRLVEESGEAFQKILTREPYYAKLAKFIAARHDKVTHANLMEALPFYKDGAAKRNEQIALAASWGYDNHIVIKKSLIDGIEFFTGETLEETDLDSLTVSYSDEWAYGYENDRAKFEDLHVLTQQPNMHWINHHVSVNPDKPHMGGWRAEDAIMQGFDMIVVDVDGDLPIEMCHQLLAGYKFMTYTTKSHDPESEHRYRLIMPMNYRLKFDKETYREFMNNVRAWLPANIGTNDETWNQRSKKWQTFEGGQYHYNDNPDAVLLDILPFIPKTQKNETHVSLMQTLQSLDSLERWFAQRMLTEGNRNNEMIKYTYALVDAGYDLASVTDAVHSFNKKLPNPLPESELETTVLVSAARKIAGV